MKLTFYQLPISYDSQDRYYGGGGSLPSPLFSLDKAPSNPANKKHFTIIYLSKLLINLRLNKNEIQNKNFNYIKLVDGNETKYYFVLNSGNILGKDNFSYNLKLDILMTYDLLKTPNGKVNIDIERKIYNEWEKVGNNLVLKNERNNKIWNNSEFIPVIPVEKTIENFPISKEQSYNISINLNKNGNPSQSIKIKTFLGYWNKIFKHNKLDEEGYYEVAIITKEKELQYLPVLEPTDASIAFYAKQSGNSKLALSKWIDPDYETYNRNNYFFKKILIDLIVSIYQQRDWKNWKHNIIKNNALQTIIYVKDIFNTPSFEGTSPNDTYAFESFLISVKENYKDTGEIETLTFDDKTIDINKDNFFALFQRNHWKELLYDKNIKLPLNDNLFKTNKTKQNNSLNSNSYLNYWIDIFGKKIKLNNRLLFQKENNLFLNRVIFQTEEVFNFYQGKSIEKNLNYQNFYQIVNEFTVQFNKDVGEINYANRKNYYDSRLSQVEIQRQANLSLIQDQTDYKISQIQNQTLSDNQNLRDITKNQISSNRQLNEARIASGATAAGVNIGAGLAGVAFGGGTLGIGIAAVAASQAFSAGNNIWLGSQNTRIQNQQLSQNLQANQAANQRRATITSQALSENQAAVESKIRKDARAQRGLILGEISDLKNLPTQLTNSSNSGLLLKPKQQPISFIKEELDDKIKEKLYLYFNKFGNENYGNFVIDELSQNWFKQNTFFNYFKGGDWEKYLNSIDIYDKDIINEFNLLFSTGIRLHHRRNITLKSDSSSLLVNPYDIDYEVANWNYDLVKSLYN